jgi:predicted dehydrogenase
MSTRIRIGVLGAARIVPFALIKPAQLVPEVEIACVAARDASRAAAFARSHGIARSASSYDALIEDPAIDAIYNPLPNSLHAPWTIRALEAGKHVLCEKPLTANAVEAERVAEAAKRSGRVMMEAFHWRYHPLAKRMIEILKSGELGKLRRIETWMCYPLPEPSNIRYRLDLAGGAGMDAGCYAVSMLRHLSGEEPEVVSARAWMISPGVDRRMEAEVRLPSGASGHLTASILSATLFRFKATLIGERGTMVALNPIAPQFFHRLTVTVDGKTRREHLGKVATYTCQLQAFAAAILHGTPFPTGPEDAVANMRVIDAVYRGAGLSPRGM